MEIISKVKPQKLYIISDEGRTADERLMVEKCRKAVENAITWPCEVIKDYACENKGCYDRIGLGALNVFHHERYAIFLEDDNLPEITFFRFCKEMLEKYEDDNRILWICGTNYMGSYLPEDGSDYVFSKHMLPCGWASWGQKFQQYYDKDFELLTKTNLSNIKKQYANKKLFRHDYKNWRMEIKNKKRSDRYCSWDYHMCFSIRVHSLLGIVPKYNQIKNIGVDDAAQHGGKSFDLVMTQRFCGMNSIPLTFPLKHPPKVRTDQTFEDRTARIILPPLQLKRKIISNLYLLFRKVLSVPEGAGVRQHVRNKITDRKKYSGEGNTYSK